MFTSKTVPYRSKLGKVRSIRDMERLSAIRLSKKVHSARENVYEYKLLTLYDSFSTKNEAARHKMMFVHGIWKILGRELRNAENNRQNAK